MNCEEAIQLLSARIDGELSADDRARIEAHLVHCADCRATDDAMRVQDAQLVRAFVPRRNAAMLVAERVSGSLHPAVGSRTGRWVPLLAATAAGFLAAVTLFRPWQRVPQAIPAPTRIASTEPRPVPVGQLDVVSGPILVRPADDQAWQPLITGGQIAAGTRLRTGIGTRCELMLNDGSELRVNEQTELLIRSPRDLELADGQIWSQVAKQPRPFAVAAADVTVTALGTRFDVQRRGAQITLAVIEGSTRLRTPLTDRVVRQGQVLKILGGNPEPFDVADALDQATKWTDQVLLLKRPDDPELSRRIDDLFAHIGQEKLDLFRANELRRMGDRCVIPLTRYLQSNRSSADELKRREAARIVADVAQPWCAGYLIELLDDHDGEVRYQAARALLRLTGENQGVPPEQWQRRTPSELNDALEAWRRWWQKNRTNCPGVPASEEGGP